MRQQLFVLIVEHETTHSALAYEIERAVLALGSVGRVGVMVQRPGSVDAIGEAGETYPVLR